MRHLRTISLLVATLAMVVGLTTSTAQAAPYMWHEGHCHTWWPPNHFSPTTACARVYWTTRPGRGLYVKAFQLYAPNCDFYQDPYWKKVDAGFWSGRFLLTDASYGDGHQCSWTYRGIRTGATQLANRVHVHILDTANIAWDKDKLLDWEFDICREQRC